MAISPTISLGKSTSSLRSTISQTGKTTNIIRNTLTNSISKKRNLWNSKKIFKTRRTEFEARQEQNTSLAAPSIITRIGGSRLLSQTDKGTNITDRLFGFVKYFTAGWLIGNLPTWINYGEQFIGRLGTAGSILSNYGDETLAVMKNIGSIFNSALRNISAFDFTDSSGLMKNSINDLTNSLDDLGDGLSSALEVLFAPFKELPKLEEEPTEPTLTPPSPNAPSTPSNNAAFWTLVAVASREDSDPQGQADVAQSIYNRVAAGVFPGEKDLRQVILAEKQYQPTRTYPTPHPSGKKTNPEWFRITDAKSAAIAAGYKESTILQVAKNITNPSLQKKAAEYIENRTDFLGIGLYPDKDHPSSTRLRRRNTGDNIFGNFVGTGSYKYGEQSKGKSSPIIGQITAPTPAPSPGRQSGISGVFNFEVHHPGGPEKRRSGLIESVKDPVNDVTRAFKNEFGSYPRGFRDLGGPKRGLNLLELADEKGIDWNAQKIINIVKRFPNILFNMFAGHLDVPLGVAGQETGAGPETSKSGMGEQEFNPKVCEKVEQLAKSAGLNNIKYRRSLGRVLSGADYKSNWSYSERLMQEFSKNQTTPVSPSTQTRVPPPPPLTGQRRLQSRDILTKSLGKDIDYVEIGDLYLGRGGTHKGIDIRAPLGTYISLRVDAEWVDYLWNDGGYGHVLDLWVPSYGVQLRFGHLLERPAKLSNIPAGTSFARIGTSGRSTGPHIHFEYDTIRGETRGGGAGNPEPYVRLIYLTKEKNKTQFSSTSTPSRPSRPLVPVAPQLPVKPEDAVEMQNNAYLSGLTEGIVQERKGQKVVIVDDRSGQNIQQIISSSQDNIIVNVNEFTLLNNFMRNKLLLDLNYV